MSLYGPRAAKLDTRTMFTHAAEEVWYMEAGVAVVATGRDDVGGSHVTVNRGEELGGEFGEVAAYQGAEVAGLVAEFEGSFDLRENGGVGFEEAFGGGVDFDAAAGEIEEGVAGGFVVERVVASRRRWTIEVLKVEDVWAGFVARFCGGDDAF